MGTVPADVQSLIDQLDAASRDAESLVAGLTEEIGTRPRADGGWSVAECLDHLAISNRVYIASMREPAARARANGRMRRGPAKPGLIGGMFVWQLEPPVRPWLPVPRPKKLTPRTGPGLADAYRGFVDSQREPREFILANADLDLAHTRFPNPFIKGVRFSLATGLHALTAHERRHLLQGWTVRRSHEGAKV